MRVFYKAHVREIEKKKKEIERVFLFITNPYSEANDAAVVLTPAPHYKKNHIERASILVFKTTLHQRSANMSRENPFRTPFSQF